MYQCLLDDGADIIENLLYILWCHLQFYLVHCKPVDMEGNLGVVGAGRPPMRRMQGGWAGGWGRGGEKEGGSVERRRETRRVEWVLEASRWVNEILGYGIIVALSHLALPTLIIAGFTV